MAFCHESYRPFEVAVQRDDELATIMVSGELDLATVPQLSAAVAEHDDAGLLVLDLTAVTFIDSTGVRALIEADRSCARSGSRLAMLAGDGPVRRLLGLCKLDGPPGAGHRASVRGRPARRRRHDNAANAQGPRRLVPCTLWSSTRAERMLANLGEACDYVTHPG
jgi:anti-sigma B factor antagonist